MRILKSIGKAFGVAIKIMFIGVFILWNIMMNCVGTLVCAITDN